jgi:hypothetical protein
MLNMAAQNAPTQVRQRLVITSVVQSIAPYLILTIGQVVTKLVVAGRKFARADICFSLNTEENNAQR